jgi:DNA replication and repair protein RecF
LAVRRLRLTDFRNYPELAMDFEARPIVLTGQNGAGKTNLLEALSFLTPGRGLRRARLGQVARSGSGNWAVAATVWQKGEEVQLGTALAQDGEGQDRRMVRIDGKTAQGPAALSDCMRAVWLTPQMDRLFLDGPSARRQFVDRLTLGLDAEHGRVASRYEKAMRDRTKLLTEGPRDAAWLDILEDRMAAEGTAMAAARRDMVARLDAALAQGRSPFPRALLRLSGVLETALEEEAAIAVEERFRARLAALRNVDAAAGRATEGPHLSDLLVGHDAKALPAEQCSTGEQKALLIAMILASARLQAAFWGAAPLVLLDEVVAHLDEDRRAALLDELVFLGAQAWMTGTDRESFKPIAGRAQFFTVAEGTLRPTP